MSDFSEAMDAHRQIIGSHSMQWCHAIGVQGFYLAMRCKVNPGEAQNAGQNPPHLGSTPGADLGCFKYDKLETWKGFDLVTLEISHSKL